MVTRRLKPMRVDGKVVHTVGLPYHWGSLGRVRGGSANDLLSIAEDPNVHIMETKALTCAIEPLRKEKRE
jgi:formate dehydrogenase major subunit